MAQVLRCNRARGRSAHIRHNARDKGADVIDSITPTQFRDAEGTEDWRVLGDGANAYFRTGSFAAGAQLVQR